MKIALKEIETPLAQLFDSATSAFLSKCFINFFTTLPIVISKRSTNPALPLKP